MRGSLCRCKNSRESLAERPQRPSRSEPLAKNISKVRWQPNKQPRASQRSRAPRARRLVALGAPLHCWTGGSRKFLAFACPHPSRSAFCCEEYWTIRIGDRHAPRTLATIGPGLCAARSSPCRTRNEIPQSLGRPRRHKPPRDRKR